MDEKNNFIATNPYLRVFYYFIKLNRALVAISGFALFVMMCTTVVARYILKVDLNGLNEYLYFCMMWVFFMGAGVGAYEKSHLNADIIDVLVKSSKARAINTFIKNTLELILYAAFFYCSILMIRRGIRIPRHTDIHHLPYLVGYAAVFYSGFMMLIYTLMHYAYYLWELLFKNRKPGSQRKEGE